VSPFRWLLFSLSSVLHFQCINPTHLFLHIFLNIGGFGAFIIVFCISISNCLLLVYRTRAGLVPGNLDKLARWLSE